MVVVEIFPKDQWKAPGEEVLDQDRMSYSHIPICAILTDQSLCETMMLKMMKEPESGIRKPKIRRRSRWRWTTRLRRSPERFNQLGESSV
jgi:hypothetical protein